MICAIPKYGSCNGDGCPLNYGNETTELSQNYGCLPDPYMIAKMKAMGLSTKIEILETE